MQQAGQESCDVLVVGGGINGAGIARDLAGRGVRVVLCERDDWGAHTSSSSTKIIHGGLRYLENGDIGLVRKALAEREVLLASAPHLMRVQRFVIPRGPGARADMVMRAGLWLYDHLARRRILPASRAIDLASHVAGTSLKADFRQGYVYSDVAVDDARLVLACVQDAAEHGARVWPRAECRRIVRNSQGFVAEIARSDGTVLSVVAPMVVNAAGPWVEDVLGRLDDPSRPTHTPHRLRLVRGSHIVVPACFAHDHAYLLPGLDGRVVFAIPYQDDFTLIGTTEAPASAPGDAEVSDAEVAYLCQAVNAYFRVPVMPESVVARFAGVRPLVDDGSASASAVSRDYTLDVYGNGPALLTVWGGKLTTFRKLAEEATDLLIGRLARYAPRWTRDARLPGADWTAPAGADGPPADFARFEASVAAHLAWLPEGLRRRWGRSYGARIPLLLACRGETATGLAGLGREVIPGLYEAEIQYLVEREWATTAGDVLDRRTKLGLRATAAERARVADWLARHGDSPTLS